MIGQGQQGTIAVGHHLAAGLGQGNEAVAGDIMGDTEAFPGGHVGKVAIQLIAGGKAHRMDNAIQAVPLFAQGGEHCLDFFIACHIAGVA